MSCNIADYSARVAKAKNKHPEWRIGQTYFNVLTQYDPILAEEIRTTPLDPFYSRESDHEKISKFLDHITTVWENRG